MQGAYKVKWELLLLSLSSTLLFLLCVHTHLFTASPHPASLVKGAQSLGPPKLGESYRYSFLLHFSDKDLSDEGDPIRPRRLIQGADENRIRI